MGKLVAQSLNKERVDAFFRKGGGGLINAATIVVAAAVFFYQGRSFEILQPAAETVIFFAGKSAYTSFAIGLIAAGFALTISGMMAGSYGVAGFLYKSQHRSDKPFRTIVAIVTILALVIVILNSDSLRLMLGSQAALAVLLPCTVVPLLLSRGKNVRVKIFGAANVKAALS